MVGRVKDQYWVEAMGLGGVVMATWIVERMAVGVVRGDDKKKRDAREMEEEEIEAGETVVARGTWWYGRKLEFLNGRGEKESGFTKNC